MQEAWSYAECLSTGWEGWTRRPDVKTLMGKEEVMEPT